MIPIMKMMEWIAFAPNANPMMKKDIPRKIFRVRM
jgi:hypothetical protein